LVFSNNPTHANIKILKMPHQLELLRSHPDVLLCTSGGRHVDVSATGAPPIFNTTFLRLSCPLLDPAFSFCFAR
jgi:hypothetical protein